MRVVLCVGSIEPSMTGIGRYTWELAKRLPKTVGSVQFFRHGEFIDDPGVLLRQGQGEASSRGPRRALFKISPPRWWKELRLQLACRGKIFHGPNYFLPPCADTGVVTVHDLSVFKYPETHPIQRIKEFELKFGRTVATAAHLITDSEAIRSEVIDFLGWPADRITAVPLGVSSQFTPRPAEDLSACMGKYGLTPNGYALCVSTLEPRKKIKNLLGAYLSISSDLRSRFPLVLAGGAGWLNDGLHEKLESCVRQGWLRWLGFVPEADLPLLYSGARLFVYPSSYEGFGLPVLEAMASGAPVVTSNRSALPELTRGAALLADPDNIDELAELITKGHFDEGWRSFALTEGLSIAHLHSWERCVEQTIRVYERAAG